MQNQRLSGLPFTPTFCIPILPLKIGVKLFQVILELVKCKIGASLVCNAVFITSWNLVTSWNLDLQLFLENRDRDIEDFSVPSGSRGSSEPGAGW